ncbi:glutathione S-transferase N-terminal domain-containing protein [Sphingomonas sp.]|uniref:glutathione S-transferase N-terminal domain-containing protein n=1 Tax=Sphingomonas sp. TaxID=28214 RepID=UPI0025EFE41C|nr:glutathione S-transferase N-terminal domain-containing protein [Sphingomonas sp.]
MIDLYYWPTPNGHKVSVALEEMELAYAVKPVNILSGEQHTADFQAISPNTRIPAIVDHEGPGGGPYAVFESGAILMYLAEKSGRFWPAELAQRSNIVQWLFFQCANIGPMFGQCGHFRGYAPERIDYGINRYCGETVRLYGLMNEVLGTRDFLAGANYSIADMATYPWCAPIVRDLHAIDINDFPNVKRWAGAIESRPAVQRGMALMSDVMKIGDPDDATREALFGKQ